MTNTDDQVRPTCSTAGESSTSSTKSTPGPASMSVPVHSSPASTQSRPGVAQIHRLTVVAAHLQHRTRQVAGRDQVSDVQEVADHRQQVSLLIDAVDARPFEQTRSFRCQPPLPKPQPFGQHSGVGPQHPPRTRPTQRPRTPSGITPRVKPTAVAQCRARSASGRRGVANSREPDRCRQAVATRLRQPDGDVAVIRRTDLLRDRSHDPGPEDRRLGQRHDSADHDVVPGHDALGRPSRPNCRRKRSRSPA